MKKNPAFLHKDFKSQSCSSFTNIITREPICKLHNKIAPILRTKITVQRSILIYGECKKTWLKRWVSSSLDETKINTFESPYCSTIWNMSKFSYKCSSLLIKDHGRVFECISLHAQHRKHVSYHLYKIQTV